MEQLAEGLRQEGAWLVHGTEGKWCVWGLLVEWGRWKWVGGGEREQDGSCGLEGGLRGGGFVLGALGSHGRTVSMGGAASVPEVGRLLPGLVEAKGGREAGEEARVSVQEGEKTCRVKGRRN